jgi:hypothetical protein
MNTIKTAIRTDANLDAVSGGMMMSDTNSVFGTIAGGSAAYMATIGGSAIVFGIGCGVAGVYAGNASADHVYEPRHR